MDKDDFFKILDDVCLFNSGKVNTDSDWIAHNSLSYTHKLPERDLLAQYAITKTEENKVSRIEMNAMKYYDAVLDETSFYEKIKKENDERKADNAYKFANGVHQDLDEYHERKNSFYERIIGSYAHNRYKYNKLSYHNNPFLEKYTFCSTFQDTCPGLKPSTNWPVSLDDLLERLAAANIEELFHQPFDVSGEFHYEAMAFIEKYFGNLEQSEISEDEKNVYEEYLTKSIQALLTLKVMDGNFGRLMEVMELLSSLWSKNKNIIDNITRIIFKSDFPISNTSSNSVLKSKLTELVELIGENESKLHPIMRNYSINEYFNINKSILFAMTRGTFSNSCSIATDSKYLYIILNGVSGGMLKVGTGNSDTVRGKVYLSAKLDSFEEDMSFSWVFVKNKLYMKTTSPTFNSKSEFGNLYIINPDTFKIEGKTKLLLPEQALHPGVRKKNENFVLLTDGENINILMLEPTLKESYENDRKGFHYTQEEASLQYEDLYKQQSLSLAKNPYNKNSKQKTAIEPQIPTDIYTSVNLMLYTFPISTSSTPLSSTSNLQRHEIEAIEEIYEAFTHLFSKEECKKALILNSWSVPKTAVYLVENEKEIKQPVLIPEKTCLLFQTNIEATYFKNMRTEFKIIKNSPFDTTQYDLLKWTIAEDVVIGYKLKEGACVIFSTNPADMKEFTYSFVEKTNNKDIPLGKEGLIVNDDLMNERKFILEAMQRENLILNKLKMPAFKDVFKEGDQAQLLLDQGFDFHDYDNIFDIGHTDKNETNENNLKSPQIKLVKPAVLKFTKPTGSNNELRPSRPANTTSGSYYGNDPYLSYAPTSTTSNRPNYNFSPYANFSATVNNNSKTKKKFNQHDKRNFPHFIVDDSASEEELLDLETSNAKRNVIKEIKGRIEKKEKNETKNFKPKEIENAKKPNELNVAPVEDKLIEDTVKGTIIKVLNCIQLTKYDNVFCYDQVKKKYFILCNGSLTSLSIMVSDTFLEKTKLLTDIADLPLLDNTLFDQEIKDFEDLYDKLMTVLISAQIIEPDLFWRYKNWNYYYTNLMENIHYRPDLLVDIYCNDYSYQLLPTRNFQTNPHNMKILVNKILKTAEINKKILMDQLPDEFSQDYKIISLHPLRFGNNFLQKNDKNLPWADWNNCSQLTFKKINENLSTGDSTSAIDSHLENAEIHLDNKRIFFLCVDGELNSLEIIASKLETQAKTGNFIKIKRTLLFLYFWVENNNQSLIITKKEKTQFLLNRIKLVLYGLMDENTNNIIYSIIISGWELFNESLESQLECFRKLYCVYKSMNLTAQKTQLTTDLELNILKINKTKCNPFKVLLQKLSQQESVYLTNNFNKINLFKTYTITRSVNKHIKNSNKPVIILKQVTSSLNPRLLSVPFHWILLGYKFSLRDQSIRAQNDIKEEINQFNSIDESSDEDVKGSLFKFLNTSNPFEKTTLSILKEKYEQKAYLLSQLDKSINLNSNLSFYSFYEKMEEEKYKILSETFWKFLSTEILVNNEDSLLMFFSDLFEMCVGDAKELSIEDSKSLSTDKQQGYPKKTTNCLDKNFLKFLYKNFNFLLQIMRLNPEVNYRNLLSYASNILNTIYSKFRYSPMKVLEEFQDKLIELQSELTKFKALTKDDDSVLNHIHSLSSTGNQTENEKCFEYNLGTEMTQIYETIKFPGAKTLVVEIELKMNKEKPCNYDVIIVSKDHGYSNMRYNTINNFNNFGTCFIMKLNSSLNKKLFLTGEEIKIISPSELEFNKTILGRNKFYTQNSQNNVSKSQSNKSNLNIKCYPYQNVVLGYDKEAEFKLNSYININNFLTKDDLINWIELIKDLDYHHSLISKILIKSVDNFSLSDKQDQDDPSLVLKEPIIQLGLNNYEMVTTEFNEFREHEAFFDNVLDYDLKLDKIYANNESNKQSDKFLFYLNKLKSFPHQISKDLEVLIYKLAVALGVQKADENFDMNFNSCFLMGIHKKIRETTVEPNNYRNLKFVSSFNSQMKSMWLIVELSFILCMVYHLNLYDAFSENNFSKNSLRQSALELIGKKLNNLLNWMSGRVTLMKGTFDNLKNYLNEIVDTNNDYIDKIKEIAIKTIKAKDEEFKNKTIEAIGKTVKIEKEKPKAEDTPTKTKSTRDSSTKEKLGFKTPNFKKKSNAKRLYQEIPKKKKKDTDKLSHKHQYNTSEQHKPTEKTSLEEESLKDVHTRPFNYFVEKYPSLIAELNSVDSYKNLKESIKRKIEKDIEEDYFGNPDKLKSICEINNLPFNESNLHESLSSYTTFVFKSISNFYNLDSCTVLEELNKEMLLNQLYTESPYYKMSSFILERLFFLLELNASKLTREDAMNFNSENTHSSLDSLSIRRDSSSQFKTFKDDDYILTDYQQKLLKSMFVFLYKANDVNLTRSLIQKQFIKIKIREIGIKSATKILKVDNTTQRNPSLISKLFLNNVGSICNSVKKDLLNEIDIESGLEFIDMEDINKILEYNIETFNENIILYKNGKSHNYVKLFISGADSDFGISDENISAHHLQNLNLMLSDINILLKFTNDRRNSIDPQNILSGIEMSQLENFILFSTNLIFNYSNTNEANHSNKIFKLKSHFADNLKLILAKLISIGTVNNKNISGLVVESLFDALESLMKDNKLDLITNVLEDLLFIAPFFNSNMEGHTYLVKLIHKLFELIENSETYQIVSLASKICKLLLKNLNNKTNGPLNQDFFDSIYQKIGKLFLFRNLETNTGAKLNDKKYFVVVHMNSPEIDYQFLVNALFYWEEKYPTMLSCYKYKEFLDMYPNGDFKKVKEKLQYIIDKYNLNANPNINANTNINNTGQKIKMFNYFNILKSKTTKMSLLEKIVDERLANLKIAVEEGSKYLATKTSTDNKDNKSSADPAAIESIKERVNKLKLQSAYQNRIKTHIKTAEQIGETACTRGFVCLEPSMPKEMAEELAMVIHKAYNRMLPHFKANLNEKVNLFSDELIYPKMPEKDNLLPGCTNTLKETTCSFMNVTLIEESIYERINSAFKNFTDTVKKLSQASGCEDKKSKIGLYNNPNFLFGVGYQTIASVNFNDPTVKRILENNSVSGVSISMIIEDLVNLIYSIYNSDYRCEELIRNVGCDFNEINKSRWSIISTEKKTKIIGMLIVVGGYYKVLRNNYKAVFKKNSEDVYKILSGGHKTGKNHSHVIFLKEKSAKIEKVNNEDLEKYKQNLRIIKRISLKSLIDALINSFEIYVDDKDNTMNKILLHLLLKILNEKEIDYDEVINLMENQRDSEYKAKIGKFLEILKIISNEVLWMEREENTWETEFIDAFERIYNKMDSNADLIYAPVFYSTLTCQDDSSFNPINQEECDSADLINKFQLPESNYVRQLPKITDLSKCTNALKNIQNFERYMVGEIFNYCQKHYSDDEYFNALHQIRNYFSKGDIVNAKLDLNTIFDNNKTNNFLWLPKEQYEIKEITKEECFPGNFYMAKLSGKFIRGSGIKSIIKQGGIGINEIPVLLLLNDNTINQALVMYSDQECGKIYTFWVAIDSLMFLENQIKIPANSFTLDQLMKEFKYLEKRLRILYSKNVLSNIMYGLASQRKLNSFDEILHYFSLSTWRTFRNNPTSGVFHNFKSYISIKHKMNGLPGDALADNKSNSLIRASSSTNSANMSLVIDELVKKILSENEAANLNSVDNKILDTCLERIINELTIDNVPANEMLLRWCMERWDNFDKNFIKIRTNLFKEYNVNFDEKLRSRNIFNIGNFSRKMLALHELSNFDKSNYAGLVLTFEKDAFLGPHAKISFYSDPYGENLIEEIVSIKSIKHNLESVVFNYPKVWMYYTPGTRIFYAYQWHQTNRDSQLPCSIVFVPHIWSILISLTDVCTSGLFVNIDKSSLEVFKKIIKKLLVHCTALNFPAELQRRIFNLTNRVILKASKYLSLLEVQKKIKLSELTISNKFNIIGIDEFIVTQLINNINNFNSNRNSEMNFSSVYVVEGVEIIISILSVIKESFNSLDHYLRETFDYSLPVWIEAVIKLGQFLNFFQGSSNLEGVLMKEIYDQLNINSQFENIIILQNIPEEIDDSNIRQEVINLLISSQAKVVDADKDIQIFRETITTHSKTCVILIDGFFIDNLGDPAEEVKKEPEEEPFWLCYYCEMENDKDNTSCVFCEKAKKTKAKEVKKEKPKSSLIKVDSYNNTVAVKMGNMKNNLKNSEKLSLIKIDEKVSVMIPPKAGYENSVNMEPVAMIEVKTREIKNVLLIIQGKDLKNKGVDHLLNKYLLLRLRDYVKEGDYINQKLRNLDNYPLVRKYISSELEILRNIITEEKTRRQDTPDSEIKPNLLKLYETLQNNGVDLWLENVILDPQSRNNEINIKLMETIRELIDLKICKEKNISLILPAVNLRFVPTEFNSLNHSSYSLLINNFNELRNIPLSVIRFYWVIIKYFNNCLSAALPFIKPPDAYSNTNDNLKQDEEGYVNIPLPKTMSAFLSSARGITFSYTKQNLIKDIIDNTEFNEDEVQIPTFKFERLNIKNQLEKNEKQSKASGTNLYSNFNMRKSSYAADEVESVQLRENKLEMKNEESLFLQAYEQAKEVDPAFFRSKKMPGDPLVAFKVNLKGENVEGIGGPYRQFFSDISAELQDKDYKNKKLLQILIPTSNNQAEKGEFKDRWTINPAYNNITALNQYEFFGILMGVCIRTGVHLTLDLSSILWKKITDESITAEDIFEFDQGLYRLIEHLSQKDLSEETFDEKFNQNFVIEFTDGTVHELITNGANIRVAFSDRFKFISLALKARVYEVDSQISRVKKGLSQMIPNSLIKLLTYKELERLVCGVKTVDISMLKTYTKLAKDLTPESNRVIWLWTILEEISEEDKIKFVKFCWAQERLPSTHQEFQKLQVTFTIKSYIDKNRKDVFPRADTCFFSIELPDYSSKEIMKKLILQAINLDNVGLNADKVNADNIQLNDYGGIRNNYYDDEDEEMID